MTGSSANNIRNLANVVDGEVDSNLRRIAAKILNATRTDVLSVEFAVSGEPELRFSRSYWRAAGAETNGDDSRANRSLPLDASPIGTVATLRMEPRAFQNPLPSRLRAHLTAWIVEATCSEEALAIEALHRLGRSAPVLRRMRLALGADAAILWHSDGRVLRVQTASGLDRLDDVDIVLGQGVVGQVGAQSGPQLVALDASTPVANPGLVRKYGWNWCYCSPLIDDSEHVGTVAFYFTSSTRPEVRGGFLKPKLAPHRYILAADVARRVRQIRNDEDASKLAQRVGQLQMGLTVLGLAHDLKQRTESLGMLAAAITKALPNSDAGQEALLRQLNRLEISTAEPELFVRSIAGAIEDTNYINGVVSAMNKLSEIKSTRQRRHVGAQLVDQCAPMLDALALGRGAQLDYMLDPSVQFRSTEIDVARILLNTVSNSLAWSARRVSIYLSSVGNFPTRLHISANLRDFDSRWACLAVVDNGLGMSDELLSVCKEPFESRRKGGTGLGLFVVDHVARSLGGQVVVASSPGVGTGVFVIVPPNGVTSRRPDTQ